MATYETIFITTPNLTEEEEQTTVETLLQIVTDGGGKLTTNDRMGRRRLAYPILKFDDGIYVRFLYDSEAAVPRELERRFRLSDRVLRYLTVRLTPDWAIEAKEQAVRDAERRVEAAAQAEREAVEREAAEKAEREKAELEAASGEPPAAEAAEAAATVAPEPGEAKEEPASSSQDESVTAPEAGVDATAEDKKE